MKTYVVIAEHVTRAEALMNARGVPRRFWRLARHPVDLEGVRVGDVLIDKDAMTRGYDSHRMMDLLSIAYGLEDRQNGTCERIGLPAPPRDHTPA